MDSNQQLDLIQLLKIEDLPEEKQQAMIAQMGEIIHRRILLRLAELDQADEKKQAFLKTLQEHQNDPEKAFNQAIQENSEIADIVIEEINRYKQQMASLLK